ncbi:MAG TPA: hypothetical protein VJN88_10660 [Ktedonobacterales bacterium]|nr:hypothetical protein [Ktedonobacterales bacterium]
MAAIVAGCPLCLVVVCSSWPRRYAVVVIVWKLPEPLVLCCQTRLPSPS